MGGWVDMAQYSLPDAKSFCHLAVGKGPKGRGTHRMCINSAGCA